MNKFNGQSTMRDIHRIYVSAVLAKEVAYYHNLVATKGYDCYGFVNASHKFAVKQMLEMTDIPYSSELGALLKVFLFESNRVSNRQYEKVCSLKLDEALYNLTMTGYIA